jgi:deoxyribodipyrimidine photolyase-related protein
MTIGVWVLGDQLWEMQAALASCAEQKHQVPVLFIESLQHVRERPYHKQKLVLVWSAMRHFAAEMEQAGWKVTYYAQAENFYGPLKDWIQTHQITELRIMEPSDRPFANLIQTLDLPCQITLLPNNHFLWSRDAFGAWAKSRKRLLLEDFYRAGRRQFQVLMEGAQPVGGRWNFDADNRRPPKGKLLPPEPRWFPPDAITQTVIQQVQVLQIPTYGQLDCFRWAVTRQQALQVRDHFMTACLPTFGPYQDAMLMGAETLWHSLLSPYLNLGLLHPVDLIQPAETAFYEKKLDLNCVEGFIRQVLGWREYIYGLYQQVESTYPGSNHFNHHRPLPDFFWDAEQTQMNCLHQTLKQIEQTGYVHHIQRLMVLSNFALIAGLSPQATENWFHAVLIDAYDWVMQPNVIGMGLFADGGLLASKPYAASANYINKMSNYCGGCVYNPKSRLGEKACPFNFLYWDFLDRHRETLKAQGRMSFILAHLDKMAPEELVAIRQQAKEWFGMLAG